MAKIFSFCYETCTRLLHFTLFKIEIVTKIEFGTYTFLLSLSLSKTLLKVEPRCSTEKNIKT